MTQAVVDHIQMLHTCYSCGQQGNHDLVLFCKQQNSSPGYLVINDKVYWDKDLVNKLAYILNLSTPYGILPTCSGCQIKLLAQLMSDK